MGVQEVDMVSMAAPITKSAVTVMDPADIRYQFEKAVHLARTGRPGPVWLDLPLDVQGAMVEDASLRGFDPRDVAAPERASPGELAAALARAGELLSTADPPVGLIGHAVPLPR